MFRQIPWGGKTLLFPASLPLTSFAPKFYDWTYESPPMINLRLNIQKVTKINLKPMLFFFIFDWLHWLYSIYPKMYPTISKWKLWRKNLYNNISQIWLKKTLKLTPCGQHGIGLLNKYESTIDWGAESFSPLQKGVAFVRQMLVIKKGWWLRVHGMFAARLTR